MQHRVDDEGRFRDPRTRRQAHEDLFDRMDDLIFRLSLQPGDDEAGEEFERLLRFKENLLIAESRGAIH